MKHAIVQVCVQVPRKYRVDVPQRYICIQISFAFFTCSRITCTRVEDYR